MDLPKIFVVSWIVIMLFVGFARPINKVSHRREVIATVTSNR